MRNCDNCKYSDYELNQEPCRHCYDEDKWEADEDE